MPDERINVICKAAELEPANVTMNTLAEKARTIGLTVKQIEHFYPEAKAIVNAHEAPSKTMAKRRQALEEQEELRRAELRKVKNQAVPMPDSLKDLRDHIKK